MHTDWCGIIALLTPHLLNHVKEVAIGVWDAPVWPSHILEMGDNMFLLGYKRQWSTVMILYRCWCAVPFRAPTLFMQHRMSCCKGSRP